MSLSRRALLSGAVVVLAGCSAERVPGTGTSSLSTPSTRESPLRLTARPDPDAPRALPPGTSEVAMTTGRTALLHVPEGRVTALVVSLHGAGGTAQNGLSLLRDLADERGLALFAPASAGPTWDAITGSGARDTAAIDTALQDLLSRLPLAQDRVAVAGFSDGASYALTLGLTNGDLLPRIVAFSPGFSAARERHGQPELLITHGVHDDVLPIDRTSRRLVPALRSQQYVVDYREFDGGHVVPADLAVQAADWLAG